MDWPPTFNLESPSEVVGRANVNKKMPNKTHTREPKVNEKTPNKMCARESKTNEKSPNKMRVCEAPIKPA